MSRPRAGALVPRTHRQTDDAIAGRAINAEPWEPLPGIVKQQCPRVVQGGGCREILHDTTKLKRRKPEHLMRHQPLLVQD
jgi:hypothetical protein